MSRKDRRRIRRERIGNFIAQAIKMSEELHESESDRKEWVVELINDKLDIPLLNEDQEKVVISLLIDVVEGLVIRNRPST